MIEESGQISNTGGREHLCYSIPVKLRRAHTFTSANTIEKYFQILTCIYRVKTSCFVLQCSKVKEEIRYSATISLARYSSKYNIQV